MPLVLLLQREGDAARLSAHLDFGFPRSSDLRRNDPQINRAFLACSDGFVRGGKRLLRLGTPNPHVVIVRDHARARLQLGEYLGAQRHVDVGQEIQRQNVSLVKVGLEQVLLQEFHAIGDADATRFVVRAPHQARVELDAETPRAVLPRRRDHDAPVARAEIDDRVAGLHLRELEHAVDDRLRRRHVRRVEFLVDALRERTRRHNERRDENPQQKSRSFAEFILSEVEGLRMTGHAQTAPLLRNASISVSPYPAALKISSVCSPDPGAGRSIENSNSLNLTGDANCLSPSSTMLMPRARNCSFASASSRVRIGLTQQSARAKSSAHSRCARDAKIAASRSLTGLASSPYTMCFPFNSGQPSISHSVSQNFRSSAPTAM